MEQASPTPLSRPAFTERPHAERSFRPHRPPRAGRCMALVDERFLLWLARHEGSSAAGNVFDRYRLASLLIDALRQSGLDVDMQRLYWYVDHAEGAVVDGQIVRTVQPHDSDGGTSLLRAMTQDLLRLAERHACDQVLLATDDERLALAVDDAQLWGLQVHLLADESALDMPRLLRADPDWARFLSQADRRVVVRSEALRQALSGSRQGYAPVAELDPEALRTTLQELIDQWWSRQPEDSRHELRATMAIGWGIPQEADRELLLLVRERLERPLSMGEKKLMRQMARATALGAPGGDISAEPASEG